MTGEEKDAKRESIGGYHRSNTNMYLRYWKF